MTTRFGRADRLWSIGGTIAAVVLLAVGWLFFISDQRAQTTDLNDRRDTAEQRLTELEVKLADLRRKNENLSEYRTKLARDRQALPTASGLSDFLRDLQTSGERAGVAVTGFNAGNPVHAPVNGASIYSLSVTITVVGEVANLRAFLDQLQQVQPRAVLIVSGNLMPTDQDGSLAAGAVTLSLNAEVFVASAGTPKASLTPAAPTTATPTATAPAVAPSGTPTATASVTGS